MCVTVVTLDVNQADGGRRSGHDLEDHAVVVVSAVDRRAVEEAVRVRHEAVVRIGAGAGVPSNSCSTVITPPLVAERILGRREREGLPAAGRAVLARRATQRPGRVAYCRPLPGPPAPMRRAARGERAPRRHTGQALSIPDSVTSIHSRSGLLDGQQSSIRDFIVLARVRPGDPAPLPLRHLVLGDEIGRQLHFVNWSLELASPRVVVLLRWIRALGSRELADSKEPSWTPFTSAADQDLDALPLRRPRHERRRP